MSQFLQFTLFAWVLLNLLIVLTYLSDPFKVFVIVFNDSDIRLLFIVLELVLLLLLLLLLRLLLLLFIWFLILALLGSLFLHFSLFFELVNSLALSNLVIFDNPLTHFLIVRVYKLLENFLLILVLLPDFFSSHLQLINLSSEVDKGFLEIYFFVGMAGQWFHKLIVIDFHISKDDELLWKSQYFHFNQS